jgi:nucleoside-diphosphate-sugar epimerase
MKKVLILGGGGFLGRPLAEMLLEEPGISEAYIFDLQGSEKNVPAGVRFAAGDRNNYEHLVQVRRYNFDCVIDLIAYRPFETEMAIKAFRGYTGSFVHLSTISAYQAAFVSPFGETQPLVDDRTNSYMNQKAECERLLRKAGDDHSFPYVILRSASVMGPHDRVSRENYFIKRILSQQPVLIPDTDKSPALLVFARDLVRAMARAAAEEAAVGKAFHLAQRELVSIRAHIEKIGQFIGRSPSTLCVPSEDLIKAGFNLSAFPYYSEGLFYPDISAACDTLGFDPTPYEDALKETVDWFMENDPLTLPAWPGKTSMQARMAAVNDSIHQLKEQAFIAAYQKIRRSCQRQIDDFNKQYQYNRVEDTVESVTGLFTGCLKSDIRRICVHENQFNSLMDSPLVQDLDITAAFICLAPGSLVSLSGLFSPGKEKHAQRTVPNLHLKHQFNTFAYLEPFPDQYADERPARYYVYYSAPLLPRSEKHRRFLYSHDYLFYVLNLHRGCDPGTKGVTYPHEIDILEDLGGPGEKQEKGEITVELPGDLTRYYFGQCRLFMSHNGCPGRSLHSMIVDSSGGIRPCFWGCAVGTLEDRLDRLQERVNEMIASLEHTRGCRSCPVYEGCPRCLFVENHQVYCEQLRKNPYRFRYIAVYDFLRQLVRYDMDIPADASLRLGLSTPYHRFLLPHLNRSFNHEDRETGKYRLKYDLLPVVVSGKNYVYDITEGTIVRLNATAFLVLEALEEGIADPLELAGRPFDCIHDENGPRALTEEEIVSALGTLTAHGFIWEPDRKDMKDA